MFVVVLVVQFRTPRYVPGVYWLTVVLISVVGTLVTDNLTDGLGVPLTAQHRSCSPSPWPLTFAAWYASERTLSIHTIVTRRREAFYWLAILFTFALGTAAGDLVDEQFGLGYWPTALLVAAIIAAITVSHLVFRAGAVLSFWLAYILTRPLGASLGDGFSQARDRRRPGPGHHGHQRRLPRRHPGRRHLPRGHPPRPDSPVPAAHDEEIPVGR